VPEQFIVHTYFSAVSATITSSTAAPTMTSQASDVSFTKIPIPTASFETLTSSAAHSQSPAVRDVIIAIRLDQFKISTLSNNRGRSCWRICSGRIDNYHSHLPKAAAQAKEHISGADIHLALQLQSQFHATKVSRLQGRVAKKLWRNSAT
jgi:hypothetical protein